MGSNTTASRVVSSSFSPGGRELRRSLSADSKLSEKAGGSPGNTQRRPIRRLSLNDKRSSYHRHNKSPDLAETTFTMTTIEEEELNEAAAGTLAPTTEAMPNRPPCDSLI